MTIGLINGRSIKTAKRRRRLGGGDPPDDSEEDGGDEVKTVQNDAKKA